MTTESMTSHDIVDLDALVVRATVVLVSQAGPADLARPTPCAGWTLGDLIGHMTTQHDGWTAAAAGHSADLSCWQPGPPAADPVGEYAAAAGRVLEAFGDEAVLGREFALAELSPVLRFPAAQAIGFHFIDYLVHGWDVARSLGVAYQPEPGVLAAALPIARAVPCELPCRCPGWNASSSTTERPRPARARAAADPASPAPMMTTSACSARMALR